MSKYEGKILDDTYRVGRVIGQGGMSAVHEATHMRLGHRVAVKFLDRAYRNQEEAYGRFRREAEIASSLGHDHIAKVTDFNTLADGTSYMIIELLEGEDLGQRLSRAPLRVDEVIELSAQLASALTAAHKSAVVHRDLKPDNIFLVPGDNGKFTVKVLDFGISKIRGALKSLTSDAQLMGTPAYMSPEQARGEKALIDERSDIYSMGAVLYEALCGRPAYEGENVYEILTRIATSQPPPLPGFAKEVDAVLQRAMARDPKDRYASAVELHRALVYALTGKRIRLASTPGEYRWETIVTAPTEEDLAIMPTAGVPVPQVSKSKWSRRRIAIAAGIAGTAIAGTVAYFAFARETASAKASAPLAAVQPPPPPTAPAAPAPAPAPEPEVVTVKFAVTPPSARVELDGKPVNGEVQLPRSTTPRVLAASAPGYREAKLDVVADRDHVVEVRLDAVKKPRARQRPKTTATKKKPELVRGSEL